MKKKNDKPYRKNLLHPRLRILPPPHMWRLLGCIISKFKMVKRIMKKLSFFRYLNHSTKNTKHSEIVFRRLLIVTQPVHNSCLSPYYFFRPTFDKESYSKRITIKIGKRIGRGSWRKSREKFKRLADNDNHARCNNDNNRRRAVESLSKRCWGTMPLLDSRGSIHHGAYS